MLSLQTRSHIGLADLGTCQAKQMDETVLCCVIHQTWTAEKISKDNHKHKSHLGMLHPSRADLTAEAVFASLNCTRAWDRRYSRQVQNQATLTTNKQILSEWLENMGTLMVWAGIVGANSNDSCCSGTVTQDRVQKTTNNWPKPSYSHHNTHLEASILFKRCNLMYKAKSRKNLQ